MKALTKMIIKNTSKDWIFFVKKVLSYIHVFLGFLVILVLIIEKEYPEIDYDYNYTYRIALGAFVALGIARALYDWLGVLIERANLRRYEYREYLLKELERGENTNIVYEANEQEIKNAKTDNIGEITEEQKDILNENNEQRVKKDIIALMLKNNDEINEYFKISKKQAKSSYRFSIFSCIAGIFMLGIAIYAIAVVDNSQLAIAGTVSGAITEIISGTVLWVHNKSALQLNHYYNALHENEKFLSAVNIADKLSDEKREDIYIEIIRKQINIKDDK